MPASPLITHVCDEKQKRAFEINSKKIPSKLKLVQSLLEKRKSEPPPSEVEKVDNKDQKGALKKSFSKS